MRCWRCCSRWPYLGPLSLINVTTAKAATATSATVSVTSLLIAMMPAMAAGTAGGREQTGIIVLADTIVYTIGRIEDMIDFTIVSAIRTTGVMRDLTSV